MPRSASRRLRLATSAVAAAALLVLARPAVARDVFDRVRHGYADSDGVRIHYATLGHGPLVVMIHGFPDFWYSWRDQIDALAHHYQVVAIDQRGYNLSDRPGGVENYDLVHLVNDVVAVIRDVGRERAVVVGHDWGGAVAWTLAMLHPEVVERLVILNLPHPRCFLRELRENPAQQAASAYARAFQESTIPFGATAEVFAGLRVDPDPKLGEHYHEALARSDLGAMIAYYKANYPHEPYADLDLPIVQPPVLVIHGLQDPFLLAAGLNGTWQWVAQPLTLVTIPGASHFVHWDAPALVTKTIKRWLAGERVRR
jgi:pimeloyl-ACP methyl ester carboxylesterase